MQPPEKKKTLFVDIETLYNLEEEALRLCKQHYQKFPQTFSVVEYPLQYNFAVETGRLIVDIFGREGFFRGLPVRKHAIAALQDMANSDWLNVWIVISTTAGDMKVVMEQLEWLKDKLGSVWEDRIILAKDKTLLKGDILLDSQPHPEIETVKLLQSRKNTPHGPVVGSPTWVHLLYDREYNTDIIHKRRFTNWKNWKSALLPQENSSDMPFFRHGSEDSQDEDRLYLYPALPDPKACRQFLSGVTDDRNIFVITDGFVSHCYKGYPDEIQNALLETYRLHPQEYPLPISERMPRIVILKVIAALFGILVRLAKCVFRDQIKSALRSGNFGYRKKVALSIDFTQLTDLRTDDYKFIAFQFGQAIGLIHGKDIYTKKTISEEFPDLFPFIYRQRETILNNLPILNKYRDMLTEAIDQIEFVQQKDLVLFHTANIQKTKSGPNYLQYQCNGIVVDMISYQVVCYPLNCNIEIASPSWPSDGSPDFSIFPEDSTLVSMFQWRSSLYLCTPHGFDISPKTFVASKYHMEHLDFTKFYFILEIKEDGVYLVGMRNRFSLKLQDKGQVEEVAKKVGFKTL